MGYASRLGRARISAKAPQAAGQCDRLREIVHYDPENGVFTWLVKTGKKSVVGAKIGSKHSAGYMEAKIDGVRYYLHRLAWIYVTGEDPKDLQIDHINGDRSDNRFSNLRLATNGQNQQNAKLKKTNKSGYKGVYWSEGNKAWVACICIDGKSRALGSFTTPEAARDAWLKASEYRGDFRRTA
jgi:hypothetical protein